MSLAQEHIADLARSGLAADVIATLQCEAVRPHDIKIQGVTSAYRLPYFALDGTRNCFERWRLFPVIQRPDGSKQKYHQPAGSDPSLYLPPLLSWNAVAKQPSSPILIVEGEKKAAAGCMKGLLAIGIGGLWNWRQRLDNGDRLVIPTIDLFQWAGREVMLVPDSDAWRAGREIDLLAGFYALGQELISRGAMVLLLQLPERGSLKVGLDDWLVSVDTEWESLWPHLKRIALDDKRLKKVTAWHQRWKAKRAAEELLKNPEAQQFDLMEEGGLYSVKFSAQNVCFLFDRLTDAQNGVKAELSVHVGNTEILGETDLNLKSLTLRDKFAAGLGKVHDIDWKPLLERACTAVLKRHRCGEPVITLEPAACSHIPFILNPLIYQGHPSLIYAPGGSYKSYLALWFALLVAHGSQQAGIAGVRSPVLYLDWELNAETTGSRLRQIILGQPELDHVRPHYRRCELSLLKEMHAIASTVAQLGVKLVVIDSAAMACGGDLASPDAAIGLQQAFRKIGCASLTLAHMAKHTQEGQSTSAYGTVFFRELARSVWELSRAEESDRVMLKHAKDNFSPKRASMGFELEFAGEAVRIDGCDPEQEPEFEPKLSLPVRIRKLLEDRIPRSAHEIAEALNAKYEVVKSTLSAKRYRGHLWTMTGSHGNAKWTI